MNTPNEEKLLPLVRYASQLLSVPIRSSEEQRHLDIDLRKLRDELVLQLGSGYILEKKLDQIIASQSGVAQSVDDILHTDESVVLLLQSIRDHQGLDDSILKTIASGVAILTHGLLKPPEAVWEFNHGGISFSGRHPVPVSIIDTDQGWGGKLTQLKDALGEVVDPAGYEIAIAVDDSSLVSVVDNGDGSFVFGSALLPDNDVDLPASTELVATVTQPDGGKFELRDTITVVAGEAVTGAFEFTAPAVVETPVEPPVEEPPVDTGSGEGQPV